MIPNAGLDNVAAYNAWATLTGSGADASGSQWLAYAAISEDSTAPSASDTNIGAEKMRTNATGDFARTATPIRDPSTNRLGVSIERAYVFAITSSMNITKYGYVPVSSGGNFSWIDLVRADPNNPLSSPITLTLQNGDQLQLWQTFTVTVPWSVDLESFVVTGTSGNDGSGTHDAYCGFFATTGTVADVAEVLRATFGPSMLSSRVRTYTGAASTGRDTQVASNTGSEQLNNIGSLAAYTPGNYYRDKLYKLSTAQGVGSLTGIALGSNTNATITHGFKIVFDDPATFVKDSVHELTLTFRVSWAEA